MSSTFQPWPTCTSRTSTRFWPTFTGFLPPARSLLETSTWSTYTRQVTRFPDRSTSPAARTLAWVTAFSLRASGRTVASKVARNSSAKSGVIFDVERFAPGFRERILATHVRSVPEMEAHNANYIGGDVVTGANTPRQLVARPRLAPDPYWLGADGLYLCSAATPPGGGAHGMCGFNAANAVLRRLGR